MEMAAIILKILLIILLMGLLVMIFLMFGAIVYDLFEIVRINLVLLHNFAISDDVYYFSHSIK